MNTKLWHLGIASIITATMGVAQAQTNPSPSSGAIINDAQPSQPSQYSNSPSGVPSDGVPGISPEARSSDGATSGPEWNNTQGAYQTPSDPALNEAAPADSVAGLDARRNQSVQSNDGMTIPPAFGSAPNNGMSGSDNR